MERAPLESAAANYPYLQGLLLIPIGLWFILVGLTRLLWASVGLWIVIGGAALAVVAYLRIARYYRDTYGRVTPPRSRQVKDAVATVIGMAVIVGAALLDSALALPISGYAAAFALVMLVYLASTVGLRTHHVIIWGALLVAGLLPVWGGLSPNGDIPVALLPMGAATIVSGILDHGVLVRTLGSTRDLSLQDSNAGA